MKETKKATKSLHKKLLIVLLSCLVLSGAVVVALSITGRQKPQGNVDLGDGFFTDINENEIAEIGIEYQIAKGKALNGNEIVTPEVTLTLNGETVAMENNAFVPTVLDDYIIGYEYKLPTGKVVEMETVLTVKDTNKPSILGADEVDTKVKNGDVLDFSKLSAIDRSGEDIQPVVQAYEGKDAEQATAMTLAENKLKIKSAKGYSVTMSAKDSSGNEEKIVRSIDVAAKDEFEYANNEDYVKKYVYGEHNATVSWNSDPQFVFEGAGSIKYEYTKDTLWPCLRFAKPMITDITKAYGISFWVYNDSDTQVPLYVCQKFAAKQKLTPHAWTKVTVTTEEMLQYLGTEKKNYGIASDMTMFQLMHNNSDFHVDGTLYFDTFMVEWEEPSFKIECGDQMVRKPGRNIVLDSPVVTGLKISDLDVTLRDTTGKEATSVSYKNGEFVAAKLTDGEYYVTYTYRNGIYGCVGSQKILVSEKDYDVLFRYRSSNGTISAERKVIHGGDSIPAAKYENGQWSRWSFITIEDKDILPLTREDSIEFWVRYEKTDTSELEKLTLRAVTKNRQDINLSPEITLEEGQWMKISLNAGYMDEYLKAEDGLRIRLTAIEGTNDLSYNLYLDDFKVVKGGNKADIEATSRYSSKNGELSAAPDKSHGTDGSVGANYSNGQWARWSFLSIDDTDILPVTEKDKVEFWVMYEKNTKSNFDNLTVRLVTENSQNIQLSDEIMLAEGVWTKISMNAAQMKKYIEAEDGLRLRMTVVGGDGNYMWYNMYIDDFKVIRDGNSADIEATSRFSSKNGELSAAPNKSHGTDGSIAAGYANGQWQRWSFISIDDSDIQPVNVADSIEFYVMYEKTSRSEQEQMTIRLMTESPQNVNLSDEITMPEGEWIKISLNVSEMTKYIEAEDGLRLRLTCVGGVNDLTYNLYIDDFKIVRGANQDELDSDVTKRYTSSNGDLSATETKVHGDDGSLAVKYTNGQWSRWSFINIDDSDLQPVKKTDTIEFWVMYEQVSSFNSLSVRLITKSSETINLSTEITLTEGEWTKISMNADQMKAYIEAEDGLRLRATINGGNDNYLWYNLYIDDFQIIRGESDEPQLGEDLLEGTIVTGSDANEFGVDFYYGGDPNYGTMNKSYADGERTVVRITRGASGSNLWQGTAKFYVAIPEGATIDKATNFSMDAWFSDYAHPWTSVRLVTADKKAVTNLLNRDWASTRNSWQTSQWSVAGFTLQGGYTLQDAKYFEIWVNFNHDVNHAIEVRLDNLKLSQGNYSLVTTGGDLSTFSDMVYGREDVVAKYVNRDTADVKININDQLFKTGLTAEDTIRFRVYVDTGSNTGLTSLGLGLKNNSITNNFKNNDALTLNAWNEIIMPYWGMNKYVTDTDGLTMYIVGSGTNETYTMYITDVEVLKFANKDIYSNLSINHNSSTIALLDQTGRVNPNNDANVSLSEYCIMKHKTWDSFHKVKLNDDSYLRDEIEAGDTIELWVKAYYFNSYKGTVTVKVTTNNSDAALGEELKLDVLNTDEWRTNGSGWMKITLDAETVQKYIEANDGLRIQSIRDKGSETSLPDYGFNLCIGALTVVKK